MFASYWSSFVRWNSRVNASSRPNACTTRTPSRPSCNVAEVRRDAVAHLEVRLVRHAAEPPAARSTRAGRSRACRARAATTRRSRSTTAPTKTKMFCTNSTRPCETSSCSASMSEVMRATSLPVFSRLEEVERRGPSGGRTPACAGRGGSRSPMRATSRIAEPAEHEARERDRRGTATTARLSALASPRMLRRQAVRRCRAARAAGPASSVAACAISTNVATTIAPRCGRSMRNSRRTTRVASSRDSVSSGTLSPHQPISRPPPAGRAASSSSTTPASVSSAARASTSR